MVHNWNELSINPSARIQWRASLVPAAAVIPAPLAYIKVVAVKTFEVDSPSRHATAAGSRRRAGASCACESAGQPTLPSQARAPRPTGTVRVRARGCDSQMCARAFYSAPVPLAAGRVVVPGVPTFTLNKLECSKRASNRRPLRGGR